LGDRGGIEEYRRDLVYLSNFSIVRVNAGHRQLWRSRCRFVFTAPSTDGGNILRLV